MSEKRILVLRQNLALRNCRTAVHFLLPLFQKIYNQLFYKRLRAGVLPLLPTTPQKAKMTDFPARTFPAARSFPTIRRFGNCVLPAVWKKRQPFLVSLSNTELLEICQKWAQKKQQIFFGFTALCAAAGWRLFNFKMKHHLMIGLFLCGCQRKSQKLSIIIYIRIFSSIFM